MIYVALLRGINIGPHKRMKMEKLVASCMVCGFKSAKTYIQSGNVVFEAPRTACEKLAQRLETQVLKDFGFSADVVCRTGQELETIVSKNPLTKLRSADPATFHVAFLREPPSPDAIDKLRSLTLAPDLVEAAEREIYFHFPNGVSGSSLWKHPLDKVLQVPVTMRNWNTVNQLRRMAGELG